MRLSLWLVLLWACAPKPPEPGEPDYDASLLDADGDGVEAARDCDDGNARVNPGAPEICNDIDDDCNGEVDDAPTDGQVYYLDQDGDGFGSEATGTVSCGGAGVTKAGDCDDGDAEVNPDAREACNTRDDDCDDDIDEAGAKGEIDWYADDDGDGWGDGSARAACEAPNKHVARDGDCNDADGDVFPGAEETCNSTDDDCDNQTDEDATGAQAWYVDGDGDGFGDDASVVVACAQPSGRVSVPGDCADADNTVNPAADEVCGDSTDNDCDGDTDEAGAVDAGVWYVDGDGDGWGASAGVVRACVMPTGRVAVDGDCNDALDTVFPGADEHCDDVDEDCNGTADDQPVDGQLWYPDGEGDGYGRTADAVLACSDEQPSGHVALGGDCDDALSTHNPGATDVCAEDRNCDGAITDASDAAVFYADKDGDGFGAPSQVVTACTAPTGYADVPGDCGDLDPAVYPGAPDPCGDSVDQDCDGFPDTRIEPALTFAPQGDHNHLATDGTTLWALQPATDTVHLLDPSDGAVLGSFSTPDTDPVGLVYRAGLLWVVDAVTGLRAVDPTDGTPGASLAPQEAFDLVGATWDAVHPWVNDATARELWRLGYDGTVLERAPTPAFQTNGLAFTANGWMLVSEPGKARIHAIDPASGEEVACYRLADWNTGVQGIALVDGQLWGATRADNSTVGAAIHRFDLAAFVADADGDGATAWEDCDDTEADAFPGNTEVCDDAIDQDCDGAAPTCLSPVGTVMVTAAERVLTGGGGEAGESLAAADFDGDGRSEVLVGNPQNGVLHLASPPTSGSLVLSSSSLSRFNGAGVGRSVAAGDFDGDGLLDVVTSSDTDVWLVHGPIPAGDIALSGEIRFAGSVAANLGDLDLDGSDELGRADPLDATNGADAGAVWVHFGPTTTADSFDLEVLGIAGSGLGTMASGDIDADGRPDLVLGDRGASATVPGAAYLMLAPLPGQTDVTTADATLTGEANGDRAGETLVTADIDGDGYDDVVVGAPAARVSGAVYVMHGPFAGAVDLVDSRGVLAGVNPDGLGSGVDAGDVDGNGLPDLLMTAGDAETAYLWTDRPVGTLDVTTATAILGPGSTGGSVVSAFGGDVDDDGHDEVMVALPGALGGGATYIFSGGGL